MSTVIVNAIMAAIDAGASGGTLKLYTGTKPVSPETGITTQLLLGTCTFAHAPLGTESGGTLTAAAITPDNLADNNGVATWARIATSAGVAVMDLDVTATGGGGAIQMVSTTIAVNGPIAFTSFTMTMP